MSINPAHVVVFCLILFVCLFGLLTVRLVLAALDALLRGVLLFAGLLAAGVALLLIAAVARASTADAEPVIRPVAMTTHETSTSLALPAGTSAGLSTANGFFTIFLISFLIVAVAVSQLLSAVLPILIIVRLVPAQDRATLADLVAALGSSHRFGVRSAVWAVMTARKHARRSGESGPVTSRDPQR